MRSGGAVLVSVALLTLGCTPDAGPSGSVPEPSHTTTAAPDSALAHRAAHTLTTLADGTHLVAGGCDVDGCSTATASAYLVGADGAAGATPTADMLQARAGHSATLLEDGRVLVTGGFAGEGTAPLSSAEVFDPASGEWERVGDLETGRGGDAAALLGDGRVLVAGGWLRSNTYTETTELFDPATGEFEPGPDLPVAADGLAATTLDDGSVLVVGGQQRSEVGTGAAVRITPDGGIVEVESLGTARFKHTVVTLPSGEALVLGGTVDDQALLRSTEVFDPGTNSFRPGPDLDQGRYKLTGGAVVLPDGRVVVAGGGPGVELLDPGSGVSTPISSAGSEWASFSTVGVSSGRVVVIGGYDRSIALTDTQVEFSVADL